MTVDEGARALEREFDLVESAVDMVAGGHAPRVVVGGIHFGPQLVEAAAPRAREIGVRVTPVWTADDSPPDVLVERDDDDPVLDR